MAEQITETYVVDKGAGGAGTATEIVTFYEEASGRRHQSVRQLIKPTAINGGSATSVAVTSAQLFAANDFALYREIFNLSDVDLWLKLGTPAVVGSGLIVFAGSVRGIGYYNGRIDAIGTQAAGTAAVAITEC